MDTLQLPTDSPFGLKEATPFQNLMRQLREGDFYLSPSSLRAFAQSPRHFVKYKLEKDEPTDAMKIGTAFHQFVQYGESTFVVLDEADRPEKDKTMASNKNKEWKAEFLARNGEANILNAAQIEHARRMAEAVMRDEMATPLLRDVMAVEQELHWERNGIKLKGFLDLVGENLIIDLKKVVSASPDKLPYTLRDMGYEMQLAMYWDGDDQQRDKNYLICVDDACNVCCVKLSRITRRVNVEKYMRLLDEFKRCVEFDLFSTSYSFHLERGYLEV